MSGAMLSRWAPAVVVAGLAVFEFVVFAADREFLLAAGAGVLLLALAWWMSPLRVGRSTPHDVALRRNGEDGTVVIYWRPGCFFCQRLSRRLGRAGRRATWVNIWADPDAAAFVRGHASGNETVPTVLLGEEVVVNPDPAVVRRALA